MMSRYGNAFVPVAVTLVVAAVLTGCAHHARKPVPGERVFSHVVAPGESLEEIADEYYGDPERADEIRDYNSVDDDIGPGDVLRLYMSPKDMQALERRKRARVPYNKGLDLASRGSYLDAINEFKKAARLDPNFAAAHYNLGVTFQNVGAYEKALDALETAVDMRPKNLEYRYAIGGVYFHLTRYDDAVAAFRRVIREDDTHVKAAFSLAMALEKAGQPKRAVEAWRRYLELDSTSAWADKARERLARLAP